MPKITWELVTEVKPDPMQPLSWTSMNPKLSGAAMGTKNCSKKTTKVASLLTTGRGDLFVFIKQREPRQTTQFFTNREI